MNTSFGEFLPAFSPDGNWLAYISNESGTNEVYVRPFPGPGGKWQISTGGGFIPQWSRNGRELFYRSIDNKIMVSSYSVTANSFRAEKPRSWSWSEARILDLGPGNYGKNFALHPDGKRVVVFKNPNAGAQSSVTKATFIFNFPDEIRRKLAASQP